MILLAAIPYVSFGLGLMCLALAAVTVWLFLERKAALEALEEKSARLDETLGQLEEATKAQDKLENEIENIRDELDQNRDDAARALSEAEAARSGAEKASSAKDTFLATMSHEVRTPLNCIRGLSEVLMATEPTEEQLHYLKTIVRSVDALLVIIGNVLDFSKMEAGRLELKPERFVLNDLVQEVEDLFKVNAERQGLAFKVVMEPASPFQVIADRSHLRQVLVNLVGNAVKYTEKGSVELHISRARIEDDLLPPNKTFYQVTFAVADTGIGIPDDKKDQLFQPFNQLVDSKTRKYEGTGLGLAITHRIVSEGMKGEIVVKNNEPQGTIFEAHIPLEGFSTMKRGEKKLTKSGLIKHALGQSFYAHKILCADDNHLNCEVMKAMLKKMGHEADFVHNGAEALDYLAKHDVDVILMDIMMPLMDGLEATRRIRDGDAGAKKKNIPIIALTAFALTSDKDEFLAQGLDHYLPKPIDPDALREILTQLARDKQAASG